MQNQLKRTAVSGDQPLFFRVIGFGLLFVGLIAFLAMIFYRPDDVPFYRSKENITPVKNSLGVFGVLFGYAVFWLFGAAAYFLWSGVVWFGVLLCFFRERLQWKMIAGFFIALLACSGIVSLIPFLFNNWAERVYLLHDGMLFKGGFIGYFLGNTCLNFLLPTFLSLCILLPIYMLSCLWMLGWRFVPFCFAALALHLRLYARFKAGIVFRIEQKEREKKEEEARYYEREQRRIQRRISSSKNESPPNF